MKIIKKPKLPVQTCNKCGCVVKLSPNDLIALTETAKARFKCPICATVNNVRFKEKETVEKTTEDAEK